MNANVSLMCLEMHIFINKLVDCVILKIHYNSNILSHMVYYGSMSVVANIITVLSTNNTVTVISLFIFVLNISLFFKFPCKAV